MDSQLVEIASYATEVEANHVKSVLAERGIKGFVDCGATNTMLSHVGASALGGIRLFALPQNAGLAREIIDTLEEIKGSDWYCGECQELSEAGFEVCWSCGKGRRDVEADRPIVAKSVERLDDNLQEDHNQRQAATDPNPYMSPGTVKMQNDEPIAPDVKSVLDVDEMVTRAYRASLIGLMLLPVLAHLYSMYLLLLASAHPERLSDRTNRVWYGAFAINMFVVLLSIIVVSRM